LGKGKTGVLLIGYLSQFDKEPKGESNCCNRQKAIVARFYRRCRQQTTIGNKGSKIAIENVLQPGETYNVDAEKFNAVRLFRKT
jgi:hypothetical protein